MNTYPQKLLIGAHTSTAGGVHNALLEGERIGATTIQLFTSNQRQWKSRVLDQDALDLWEKTVDETGLQQIMSHDSYLINLGSPDEVILHKSKKAFRDELIRCTKLNIAYLNFHPGSAKDDTIENCLDRISESLLEMEELVLESPTRLLLETTAGQGSNVGYTFEQLDYIIKKVEHCLPIGVCIDTCHIFAAGYDIRTAKGWEETLIEFDRVVGLNKLYAFHLNDSMKELGSRRDRHAALGEGEIGMECFQFLMQDPRTREIPKYLETPGGPELWVKEIKLLRDMGANHENENQSVEISSS